jgi:molybdenum cofactor cytidylyltransferase
MRGRPGGSGGKAWIFALAAALCVALGMGTGAVVFLLADQPQVPPAVIRALVARHASSLAPVVAPSVAGQRTSPTLFDRDLFAELRQVTGDRGGRDLLSLHPIESVEWPDSDLLLDVDTPADYERLVRGRG